VCAAVLVTILLATQWQRERRSVAIVVRLVACFAAERRLGIPAESVPVAA